MILGNKLITIKPIALSYGYVGQNFISNEWLFTWLVVESLDPV